MEFAVPAKFSRIILLAIVISVASLMPIGVDAAEPPGAYLSPDSLATGRSGHTATLLDDGRIFITGGVVEDSEPLASTELYDPVARTVIAGPVMSAPRSVHTATLLPDGRVLLAGGFTTDFSPLASVEIFDPATDTISSATAMLSARSSHSATLLEDGQVLVVGGFSGTSAFTGAATAAAELFDGTTWTATGSLDEARESQTATRLLDGRVLIAAGQGAFPVLRASAEIYDPQTGTFAFTGSLSTARWWHTATLLPDGTVLIAGGNTDAATGVLTASIEQFDPGSETFTSVGNLSAARAEHTATLLLDDTILMFGGVAALPERWDPATNGTEPAGVPSVADRSAHTATVTAAGRVAIIGGFAVIGGFATTGSPIASIERYEELSLFPIPNIFPGWNLIVWDGGPTPLPEALTDRIPCWSAIWQFDNASQSWDFFRLHPAFSSANTLGVLETGNAYWIRVSESC